MPTHITNANAYNKCLAYAGTLYLCPNITRENGILQLRVYSFLFSIAIMAYNGGSKARELLCTQIYAAHTNSARTAPIYTASCVRRCRRTHEMLHTQTVRLQLLTQDAASTHTRVHAHTHTHIHSYRCIASNNPMLRDSLRAMLELVGHELGLAENP